MPSIYLLTTLFLLLSFFGAAQNPHPHFRNYTTDHGLPSPEVHYCLEDERGYIWFATDNGVSRFDGYEFRNYGPREGLQDPVVFYMQLDSRGRLWMATLSGHLFFAEGDSIHAFAGNGAVESLVAGGDFVSDFRITKNDDKYLTFRGLGALKFRANGSHHLIQAQNPLGAPFILEMDSQLLFSYTSCPDSLLEKYVRQYRGKGLFQPLEWHGKTVETVAGNLQDAKRSSCIWALALPSGNVLAYLQGILFELEGKRILWQKEVDYNLEFKSIFQLPGGGFLVGLQQGKGLRRYRSLEAWKSGDFETLLPGKTISHVYQDRLGGFWVGTVEHGIFYCPDIGRKVFDASAGLPMDFVSAIAFGRTGELLIGMRNAQIFRLDLATDQLEKLPSVPSWPTLYDLEFDHEEGILWAANGHCSFFQNDRWETLQHFSRINQSWGYVSGKNFMLRPGTGRLWSGSNATFGGVDVQEKKFLLNSFDLGLIGRTLAVWEAADGRIWVGRPDGLFEFRDSQLVRPQPFHPDFGTRVDDLAEMSDGTLVIASKGQGLLLWRDTFFQQFTVDNGLVSNMLENVHVDAQGRIWVGSLQGLSRVTLPPSAVSARSANSAKPIIENFTKWNGLPSNEITQVRSRGDQVWVATTRGLLHWSEPQKNTSTKPPFLQQVLANGQPVPLDGGMDFPHGKNNLTFQFLKLNFGQAGQIPYRYRLNDDPWIQTPERAVNFAKLPPGEYNLQVQSQNEDGLWSAPLDVPFQIAPPWWMRWWFYLTVVAVLGLAVFGFYKYRTGILKKELDLQKQVTELEKKALQAQMNPHFIFNCLTSIQKLILEKDGENAVRYLTRFSKLVRGNLNVSVAGEVSLQEEIDLLTNYLSLEKMRFKDAFDFEIKIDPSLDLYDVAFPPMLLQPYVENAVLHGMTGKESGGRVSIAFQSAETPGSLLVTITDNGPGLGKGSKVETGHHSVGMSITQRRLELLNGPASKGRVTVEEIAGGGGKVAGTRVAVRIG